MFPASLPTTKLDVLYWSGRLNLDRKVKNTAAQTVFFFIWGVKKKSEIKVSNTKEAVGT